MENNESKITSNLESLCDTYTDILNKIITTLNKTKKTPQISSNDKNKITNLLNEANDHLQNLTQFKIDLNNTKPSDNDVVLELGLEIIANTFKFFEAMPSEVKKTTLI